MKRSVVWAVLRRNRKRVLTVFFSIHEGPDGGFQDRGDPQPQTDGEM